MGELTNNKTVKKNMTLYRDQVIFIESLADLRHRGNFSAAMQEIVDVQMRQSKDPINLRRHNPEADAEAEAIALEKLGLTPKEEPEENNKTA